MKIDKYNIAENIMMNGMEQNNSNIPVVKIGDTIYEDYNSCDLIHKRTVKRITKTQIILDCGIKLRNNPSRMYGDEKAYSLSRIGEDTWNNAHYYLETEKLIVQYKHKQLLLETKKKLESLNLEKLTNEQLNILLVAISQIEIKSKSINKENQ